MRCRKAWPCKCKHSVQRHVIVDLFLSWSRKVNLQKVQAGGTHGVKLAIASVQGHGIFGQLKHESGVHRVQRIPKTESQGRVHTSAASVAILPQAEEVTFWHLPQPSEPWHKRFQWHSILSLGPLAWLSTSNLRVASSCFPHFEVRHAVAQSQ